MISFFKKTEKESSRHKGRLLGKNVMKQKLYLMPSFFLISLGRASLWTMKFMVL